MAERVKDRRGRERIAAKLDARIESDGKGFEATVSNISMSGLLLLVDQPIPEMTMVRMRVALPAAAKGGGGPGLAFELTGAVVRCQPVGRGAKRRHELAVFFTDMPAETRSALQAYIAPRLH